MKKDAQLLRLLSLFYYLGAGFAGLLPLLGAVGLGTTVYYMTREDFIGHTAPPTSTDKMILVLGIYAVLVGNALTVGFVLAGRYLQKRTHYTFCFVMAVLACTFALFGTVLGVFTIVVLLRPTVKALFEEGRAR